VSNFGITAQDFADRVTIADVGNDVQVTIDNDLGQTVLLLGIPNPSAITVQDFLLL
jgi:hypothetical protein